MRTLALLLALCCPLSGQDAAVPRPNLVLIVADDLGPEWVGCYGGEDAPTPHIDALAAAGLRLTEAWSMPKCTPTRVTLLTGQYPFRHGWVNHWDVPRWGGGCHFDADLNLTFARVLRDAGYRTAIAGKWQIDDFREEPGDLARHGFEEWCMWTGYEDGNPPSAARYHDPHVQTRDDRGTRAGAFGPDVFCDFLVDFAARHRDEPFVLYYPMVLPHAPLVAPPGADGATTPREKFRAMVRHLDANVGRLTQAIDALGLGARTYVIFTGDNGTDRGRQNRIGDRTVRGGKGLLGENGVRTPFVVRSPGQVPAGATSGALLDTTDLFPTLLGLAGVAAPPGAVLDGHDLSAVLRGADPAGPRTWALTMGGGTARLLPDGVHPDVVWADRALRGPRYKLVVHERRPAHLYDLLEDPGETTDLVGSDAPEVVAERDRLLGVALAQPLRDASPRYAPLPDRASPLPTGRPNVVLLMADDLGNGDLGNGNLGNGNLDNQGHPRLQTPHLDAMAADGVRFTHFHAAAPVCSPTRGACLTGRHPYRYGIRFANDGHLPAEEITLQGLLHDAGYRTGHFGKWHLGTLTTEVVESNRGGPRGAADFAPPWQRGFDICFSTEAKVPTYDPMRDPADGQPFGTHYWNQDGAIVEEGLAGDDSRVILDRVEPFVRDCVAAKTPFLAVVWFHAPHLPVAAGAEDRARYADLDEETQRYYGCITAMDREVGRLRAVLAELGVADDTIVWFCSDNGPEGRDGRAPGSTGGLRGRKRSLYEGGTRVPGLLVWPRRLPRRITVDAPAVTSDFLPTLARWTGVDVPADAGLDGIDLGPIVDAAIAGAPVPRGRGIGFESQGQVAWVEDRFKLIGFGTPRQGTPFAVERYELYDLLDDPAETRDLAAAQPARVAALQQALDAWRRGIHAAR
ncbi:MAG: sulfatase-like hydrolase/transferase [Planctomycetes bacterium]|nr:sulfatase-like hydrolase/transferase [Planctomycetota bacterium]